MSAETLEQTNPASTSQEQDRPFPWLPVAWFAALLVLIYFPVIRTMIVEFSEQEEMGHGFFVPLVAGYVVWNDRHRLARIPVKTWWPAVLLVVWGFLQMLAGFLGADFFLARTGFYCSLVGVIWSSMGTQMLRALAFPLFLMLFTIRIPLFIYQQITFPLQLFASSVAEHVLTFVGIPVLRDGNILELSSQRLSVVEACSGIRSLISLLFLSLVYGYFFESRIWVRGVLFVATIPIAILANALRVALTGVFSEWNTEFATGIYHTFEGWVIFVIALFSLLVVHQVICRLKPDTTAS